MTTHDDDATTVDVGDDRSLGELFGELSRDLGTLVSQQVALAKVELQEDVNRTMRAGRALGAAAVAGYLALLLLSFAAAWGLHEVMPEGVAFLIVALAWGIAAATLFASGRKQLQSVHPVPEETIETLKEDVQWAKQQVS